MVQFLTALLVFAFVLALTYFTVRWVGAYQKIQPGNRNFEVIETCKVTNNKFMQIVKVGSRYFLIEFFTELQKEDLDLSAPGGLQGNFMSLYEKAKERIHKRGDGNG